MEGNIHVFPLICQSLLQWRKTERLKACLSIWIVLSKTIWNQTCYWLALSWGWWRWGEPGKEWLKEWGLELKEKYFEVITSCLFQFQKQIPSTCQQPSTNSHCQNEHISKVVSFGKRFYDTNKTLKLLTADECGLKRKVLTICSHLHSNTYLGK